MDQEAGKEETRGALPLLVEKEEEEKKVRKTKKAEINIINIIFPPPNKLRRRGR